MFDQYAQTLFGSLPALDGLSAEDSRRALSRAYLAVIQLRLTIPGSNEETTDAIGYLRRLAGTAESGALFDNSNNDDARRACAFVAAEALALVADFCGNNETIAQDVARLRRNDVVSRLEAALLYLTAHFDACAAGVLAGCPGDPCPDTSLTNQVAEWCFDALSNLCQFRLTPLPPRRCPITFHEPESLDAVSLLDDTAGRLYGLLGEATAACMHWLAGEDNNGLQACHELLRQLIECLQFDPTDNEAICGHDYGRVHHLACLLQMAVPELANRAICHIVPAPEGGDAAQYRKYLRDRAVGREAGETGRAVLWPSARQYVSQCIQAGRRNAVVTMPTGSGKSFVAELAISQNIGDGWCLYLVPTNALAEQVRADLRDGLESLETDVIAFIGDQDYSTLPTETVTDVAPNTVAVMTPEKCSLALRRHPQAFRNCQLVVFDECHLLGDTGSGRGVTAELVISRLMLQARPCSFMLMSAIVQNPADLAGWLQDATGETTEVMQIPWRPTRTLRAALGVDAESFRLEYPQARAELHSMPARRKGVRFDADYSLVAGLQGAWQDTEVENYTVVTIPAKAELKAVRQGSPGQWQYSIDAKSWVNESAKRIAEMLGDHNIQTLVFIPASRHYPFSVGAKLALAEATIESLPALPTLIGALRRLAEYEFGLQSEVFALLERGIAIHTSHMIETEKIASETAFRSRAARVMLATGTLAQGLNLPAMAVVIAGTRIGDPRGQDSEVIERRKLAQLVSCPANTWN